MCSHIGEKIAARRKELGWSQEELAQKMGYTSRSTINKIEMGKNDISATKAKEFAKVLNCPLSFLMGWEDVDTKQDCKIQGVKIPVLGRVAAGVPIYAIEEIIDYEEIHPRMAALGSYYALLIKGDSMEPKMSNGDIVIVKEQSDVDSGQIGIVLINGQDATCKKIKKYENGSIALVSSNPAYEPIVFTPEEIENMPVKIIGRVVELRAKF